MQYLPLWIMYVHSFPICLWHKRDENRRYKTLAKEAGIDSRLGYIYIYSTYTMQIHASYGKVRVWKNKRLKWHNTTFP